MGKIDINADEVVYYEQLFDSKFELGVRLQDKNISFPSHSHDYVEIVCQINESSIHYVDGVKFELMSGELLIINPSQTHENVASSSDVVNLIVSIRFLTNLVIESAFDYDVVAIKNNLITHVHLQKYSLTTKMNTIINTIFKNIINTSEKFHYIKQRTDVTKFIIEFFEHTTINSKQIVSQKFDVLTYIHQNLDSASLTDYAKKQNFSVSTLSQIIKKEYNLTFIEIVHEIRLKKAANLLQTTNKKIDDIVYDVGYQNKTHFYKLFKDRYMMTPNQFRKLYK